MRILIGDGDPETLCQAEKLLSGAGFEVIEVTSGVEAVAKSQETAPDAIVLAVDLQGMSGPEAARKIRSEASLGTVPILLVGSGVRELESLAPALAGVQIDDFVHKPYNSWKLLDHLGRLVNLLPGSPLGQVPNERRKHNRLPLDARVIASLDNIRFQHTITNVSVGGLLVRMGRALPLNRETKLRFCIPGGLGWVSVTAVVVWSGRVEATDTWGSGIQFRSIDAEDLKKLEEYTRVLSKVVGTDGRS